MKLRKMASIALLVTGLLGISQVSEANLISNGSFELGDFVPDSGDAMSLPTGSTAMTDWMVINTSIAWIGGSNPWLLSASAGNFFLDLAGYYNVAPFGGVSQMISTSIGQTYQLAFDLGSSSLYGGPNSILASAGSTSAIFTGALTGGNSDWERFMLPFTASSTNTTISLVGDAGVYYIGLDNVSVVATGAPVPEPATMLLLGTGIAGLAGSIIKRKKK